MTIQKKIQKQRERRKLRVKSKIQKIGLTQVLRLSVFRSLNHIYAQLIDDAQGKTVVSASTLELKNFTGDKTARARMVGIELARKAREKNIEKVVFDRGPFLFHGRVKELAAGLIEGGLEI